MQIKSRHGAQPLKGLAREEEGSQARRMRQAAYLENNGGNREFVRKAGTRRCIVAPCQSVFVWN